MKKYKLINRKTKEEFICEKINDIYVEIGTKKQICTTNPNIDIPKVIDEVEESIKKEFYKEDGINFKRSTIGADEWIDGLKTGYKKHKETNPFSEEDLKELLEFLTNENSQYSIMYGNQKERFSTEDKDYTIEQFIEIWKEQKVETIYFE